MRTDFTNLDGRWLCVQVRSGSEFRSALGLNERGYETFLPEFSQRLRRSDRTKVVQIPLFTGYVFLRFRARNIHTVLAAPGVLRLVGSGRMPIPVEDGEIEALQIATRSGLVCGRCAFLAVGEEVEVRVGPLASVRGRIVRVKNKHRVILSVNLIQKSVFVEIDGLDVGPVFLPANNGVDRMNGI